MRPALNQLKGSEFDLLVVGGGITGAFAAYDAALRGLSVALVERRDFGGATSAASSRLLHGGIRYLQHLRVDKVRESARERATFERIAPHLTRRMPVIIPASRGAARGRAALASAVRAYALLIRDIERVAPEYLTVKQCLDRAPVLAGADLTGAYVISECQMTSSERMTLTVLRSAVARGAAAANYLSARSLVLNGGAVKGIVAEDEITGERFEIRARVVLQARGPWSSDPLENGAIAPRVHWNSKGVHAVTRPLSPLYALALATSRPSLRLVGRGGRHIFVQPWSGGSLIGTTNSPFNDGPEPTICAGDIQELIDDVNNALPAAGLTLEDVRRAYVGLFPNTRNPSRPEVYQATGDWLVVDHGRVGDRRGLFSIVGVKFTTARAAAEGAVDAVARHLKFSGRRCATAETALLGGDVATVSEAQRALQRTWPGLSGEVASHLIAHYGSEAASFVRSVGLDVVRPLSPEHPVSAADIRHAIAAECAVHLDDIVHRRTSIAATGRPSDLLLQTCADVAAAALGWSAETRRAELERVDRSFPLASISAP